jgi:hypothetical protein
LKPIRTENATRDWRTEALAELVRLGEPAGRWAYRRGGRPGVEPTALACLGLLAATGSADEFGPMVEESAEWLARLQGQDGSLGLAEGVTMPGWTTPYALLVWQALSRFDTSRRRASNWLLRQQGRTIPKEADTDHIVGHDTTLVGWPWVVDTHSWLEPTAMAVLALRREHRGNHPRVEEGLRLIRDRAIPEGGWNYGNKAAFGHSLRPQPAPTGLALLALAGTHPRDALIDRAVRYLEAALTETRAPASLAWGVLGLRAWDSVPAEASNWLLESFRELAGRPEAAPRLALLLLASGERAMEILIDGSPRGGGLG